jgi:hypothetical protein
LNATHEGLLMIDRNIFLVRILTALLMLAATTAAAEERICGVKYVSAEHVYLDAGTVAGLTAGMQVKVVRGTDNLALLEVVFTAEYSASCKILSSTGEILPGDTVVFDAVEEAENPSPVVTAPVTSRTRQVNSSRSRPVASSGPRVSGSVAVQWDHSEETADRALTNDFVRVPFRMRVSEVGAGMEFRARGYLRKIYRSGYSASTPTEEWRNRVHEVSLVRDDRRQDLHLAVGRIGTRATASAGSFDGLSLSYRMAGSFRLGVFGGFSPDWGTMSFSTDSKLAGVSANLVHQSPGGSYLDIMLAGVGRYTLGEVSREYLTVTTSWRDGSRLSLLQAAEVDLNRDWRKNDTNNSVELTSLALTGRYKLNRLVSLNLGYDDREPVRTWESRTLPDSLFTDAGRTGWRGGLNLRGGGKNLNLSASRRDKDGGGQLTTSWQGRFYWPRLPGLGLDLQAAYRAFDGPYLSGWSPTLGLSRSTRSGMRIGVEGGYYVYSDAGGLPDRNNSWVTVSGSQELGGRFSVQAEYRNDWGDDIAGRRWFLELRRRF